MKIVIAPDSFKESLSALEAAEAIQKGLEKVWPEAEFVLVPMADGGEGTVQSLIDATRGTRINQEVCGPLGQRVSGFFGLLGNGKTAVIEMAAAAGLEYVPPEKRNPMKATTYGVGELIRAALDRGARHILLGLGGSATNDGGCGMAQALGARLLDKHGHAIGRGGAALRDLETIDMTDYDPRIAETTFEIATDVTNPLTGKRGASTVFGPQKGASPEDVALLDRGLKHYAEIVKRDLNRLIDDVPGAGAAGGLGAGALCFLQGTLLPGINLVIKETKLEEKMHHASLVITGEGKIDGQTIYGKAPVGVARAAKNQHIPVIAFAGSLAEGCGAVYDHGIDAFFSIVSGAIPLKEALRSARENLIRTGENVARVWTLAEKFRK
ncbi:glycerate kinase [Sporolactobacillus pectinivorans]|uniref:glycerate kinase n=1 Tax=Sporolactobacillus pectinivorans TaxID=1591408 RepID=UPI000C25E206|nr:glycerate kinase [Sporolactobacillus pectinivorans]